MQKASIESDQEKKKEEKIEHGRNRYKHTGTNEENKLKEY